MTNNTMKNWLHSSYLTSTNRIYVEKLYEIFLNNPHEVDKNWNVIFKNLSKFKSKDTIHSKFSDEKFEFSDINLQKINIDFIQQKVFQLINSFRVYGHQHANLDPLKIWKRNTIECLNLNFYNFTQNDLQKKIHVGSFGIVNKIIKLIDLYQILKKIYCDSIGIEYMHINNFKKLYWIQEKFESPMGKINFTISEKKQLLNELIQSEIIEQYLGTMFPGTKRFSLEGGDVLIPALKEIIRQAAQNGMQKIILSMAHRGRLNVLVNILNKQPRNLFKEFSDKNKKINIFSGDVKYHQGLSTNIKIKNVCMEILLLSNPSHLEIINPVAMGLTRAYLDKLHDLNKKDLILPITIHGDAAIAGQGIVQETLNMSRVPAYDVGGTVRIVINNQIGFTTSNSHHLRSSQYCTDIGKMLQIPIFHVNGDDPEKVISTIRIALNFRNTFKSDVLIDLVCYRRHGHNEIDEPRVTQPLMYQKIHQHPSVCKIYSDHLKIQTIINDYEILKMENEFQNFLNNEKIKFENISNDLIKNHISVLSNSEIKKNNNQNVSLRTEYHDLKKLALSISHLPKDFKIHPRVNKIYQERLNMAKENQTFDWGATEILTYATLLDKGITVRLSGEDTARGTFFHRHAVVYNQNNGNAYIPLSNLHENQGNFLIWDSVLSEEATLAFEYGYSLYSSSNTLVIWEAQFGDFANGAQIVIDQFISSGEQKWGQTCNLVIFLPHGYEGQGPEHSSARLERYLQLCAENNMRICIPSTPSQMYHLLRNQVLCKIRKPLIILTPKSLLRHPMVNTSLSELTTGNFQNIIKEKNNDINQKNIKRMLICSGKIYYDLFENRKKNKKNDTTIIRIERLYPFPLEEIKKTFNSYNHVKYFAWCQEEPKNQGAWNYIKNCFNKIIPNKNLLHYIGRPAAASPAVGYFSLHQEQQEILLDTALNLNDES